MTRHQVILGTAEEVLPTIEDESAQSCVTDPPSSIEFMGKQWDADKGGREAWVEWLTIIMTHVYRILVPGAWCFVWAIPRRSHWTGWAVESAGFEVRDVYHAMFGTGMPKGFLKAGDWKDYGTGLKPVCEHWIIGRKPFEGSTASCLDEHGTGAFRVDDCLVDGKRYPPHLSLVHRPECVQVGTRRVKTGKAHRSKSGGVNFGSETRAKPAMEDMTYADADGTEEVPMWACVPGCIVRAVDEQSGGASRFWPTFQYVPKPSSAEKNDGCEDMDPRDWRSGTKQSTPRSGQLYEHVGRKGKDRPNNHPCLHPNEAVLTDKGWFDIKTITLGEMVLGADGQYHRVIDVSSHRCDGPLYRVRVGERTVLATGNHPFLVWVREVRAVAWLEARLLKSGDFVLSPLMRENERDTVKPWVDEGQRAVTRAVGDTSPNVATIERTTEGGSGSSTSRSGRKPTVPCPQGSVSIIGMGISKTTSCPTSNLSMTLHTSGYTLVANSEMVCGGSRAVSAENSSPSPTSTGTSPSRDGSPTVDADHVTSPRSFERSNFAAHEIESVEKVPYNGLVWNLTVEGSPTFQTRVGMSHNTVKPVKLMRGIVRLCTPPGGLVLDPFNGSGTTGVACVEEGLRYLGVEGGDEDSPRHVEVSRRRIAAAQARVRVVERPKLIKPTDGFM